MHLDYIKEFCELPPLNRPQYDEDTETWDIHFTEKEGGNPYNLEQEVICLAFETLEEANETLQQALELYYEEQQPQEKD